MDPLEISYDSLDQVPETFRPLYQEKDGKAVLTGVNGLKTQQDVNNVQEALRKERNDHSQVREALKAWGDLKPDEVRSQLDRIKELEAAAEGKIDDNKLNQIVESRIGQKTAPLERQLGELKGTNETLQKENQLLKSSIQRRDLNDAVRSVATEMKVVPTAMADVEMVAAHYLEQAEDGSFIVKGDAKGITPGLDVKGFMREMQKLRPHWWPQSQGGGAGGGGGQFGGANNPWSRQHWNLTEQGKVIREQGGSVAEQMAKAAGSKIGATRPPEPQK